MKSCLGIFRTLFSLLLSVILFVIIVVGIPTASFSTVINNRNNLKGWLSKTNTYEKISDQVVEGFSENIETKGDEGMNIDDEQKLEEISENTVTKQWLQENFEGVIDGVYNWLEGRSSMPEFSINIGEVKDNFATEFSTIAKDELAALPTCTNEQMQQQSGEEVNPFEADCLPPDFDINDTSEIEAQITKELEKQEVFKNDTLSFEQLKSDDENVQKAYEQVSSLVNRFYSLFSKLQMIVIIVVLVLSAILFLVVPKLSNKFLLLGIVWSIASASLIFSNLYINSNIGKLTSKLTKDVPNEQTQIVENIVRPPLELALTDVFSNARQLAIIMIVLGLIFVFGGIVLKFSKRKYYVDDDEPKADSQPLPTGNLDKQTNPQSVGQVSRSPIQKQNEGVDQQPNASPTNSSNLTELNNQNNENNQKKTS